MDKMEKNNVKVDYCDLLDLGFKRMEIDDSVHMMLYGYPYFILTYGEENDQVSMEWSPVDKEVTMYINSQTYKRGLTLEEVEKLVNMIEADFGEVEQEDADFGEVEQEYMDDEEWLLKLDKSLGEFEDKIFFNRSKLLEDFEDFVNKVKEIKI
jgi:hypothetical protein